MYYAASVSKDTEHSWSWHLDVLGHVIISYLEFGDTSQEFIGLGDYYQYSSLNLLLLCVAS
jgi:hypothetical protein